MPEQKSTKPAVQMNTDLEDVQPKPSMTREAVQAATPRPARAERRSPEDESLQLVEKPKYRMSEGVRADLEMYGFATDPITGKRITK